MQNDLLQDRVIGTNGSGVPQQRNQISIYFSILKRQISEVIANAAQKLTFKVNLQNDQTGKNTQDLISELRKAENLLKKISAIQIPDHTPKVANLLQSNIQKVTSSLDRLASELIKIQERQGVNFPDVQKVEGRVIVDSLPDNPDSKKTINTLQEISTKLSKLREATELENPQLNKLITEMKGVADAFSSIKFEVPAPVIHESPIKIPAFPKQISISDGEAILDALEALKKSIEELPGKIPQVDIPTTVSVDNFPPQKYPLPVTNININSLRGPVKSSAVSVGATATALPSDQLEQRRSMIVYNNSSQTLYLGGEDVTTTNGLPIEAGSFSPPMDIGDRVTLYGIVASSTANVRVFEASMDDIGS